MSLTAAGDAISDMLRRDSEQLADIASEMFHHAETLERILDLIPVGRNERADVLRTRKRLGVLATRIGVIAGVKQ